MPTSRLLVIAYACAPHRGSEWGLSWNFARELARTRPVWLITHAENRPEMDAHLLANPPEHPLNVTYVTLPRWINWLGARSYSLFNIQYYLWHHAVARTARRLHAWHRFDIVHHVSLVRWWMHSAAAALAPQDVTFVFGPVGGGEPMPAKFSDGIGWLARAIEWIRCIAVKLWSFDPHLGQCARRSTLALAGTPHAATMLQKLAAPRIETMSSAVSSAPQILENAAMHRTQFRERRAGTSQAKFRVVSSGGLSYYRGVDLCLRAFAKAALPDAEYLHASDGPDRPRLEALAHSLGIADRVTFLGDQPHAENVKVLATADVYTHAVLRDSQGLIPDAMALGIPVLTLDHNTMALLVDDSCGHKVPMDRDATPERVVDEMADVLRKWHDDAALRESLGRGGMARSKQFTPVGRAAIFSAMHARLLEEKRLAAISSVRLAANFAGTRLNVRG